MLLPPFRYLLQQVLLHRTSISRISRNPIKNRERSVQTKRNAARCRLNSPYPSIPVQLSLNRVIIARQAMVTATLTTPVASERNLPTSPHSNNKTASPGVHHTPPIQDDIMLRPRTLDSCHRQASLTGSSQLGHMTGLQRTIMDQDAQINFLGIRRAKVAPCITHNLTKHDRRTWRRKSIYWKN